MANAAAIKQQSLIQQQLDAVASRSFKVGILGLGYVGLPLAFTFWQKEFGVIGFDVDAKKIDALNAGQSYIGHIPATQIAEQIQSGRLVATADAKKLHDADALIICVPTPLTKQREPDLSYVENTTRLIVPHLRRGQLVVLESTTYPGTTRDVMVPILEQSGLKAGVDFFVAYSPEREDPGNQHFATATINKVVGADDADSLALATALYSAVVTAVVPVSSAGTAEAVKLTENIFRAVNIALVNELKMVFDKMDIDIWEVIDAAKTKPFGFMPFYPGPGLGGHCIPIDPFYLTWKAREVDVATRFIELAGEVNNTMPVYVVGRLAEELDRRFGRGLKNANILIMGAAYKKNVDDIRESPFFKLVELLHGRGAVIAYHDPYIPVTQSTRHPYASGLHSVALTPETIAGFDAVLICTDHDNVDYAMVVQHAAMVVDTRNATKAVTTGREKIVKA